LTLFEVTQAAAIIREAAHPEVNIKFGAVIDPNLGDELRITIIATGFERAGMPRRILKPQGRALPAREEKEAQLPLESVAVEASRSEAPRNVEFKPQVYNTDDLDIPTFLRNRR